MAQTQLNFLKARHSHTDYRNRVKNSKALPDVDADPDNSINNMVAITVHLQQKFIKKKKISKK